MIRMKGCPAFVIAMHNFRMKDAPTGPDTMSARDEWRYKRSLERYNKAAGLPSLESPHGEIGRVERFRFIITTPPKGQ